MDEDLQTIEQSFEMIPEEVKSYIYSDTFSNSFYSLCDQEQLSDSTKKILHADLYQYIAQILSEETLLQTIYAASTSIESSQRIINWVKSEVSDKIVLLTTTAYEAALEEDDIEGSISEQNVKEAIPSPLEALTMIKDRLTTPQSISATKHDYSNEIPTELPHPPTNTHNIDPYRELPEK